MKYSVYHYTRRYMRSTEIRILAAFMAFLIFTLAFQQAFVSWNIIMVKAAEGDITRQGAISSTTTQTSIKSGVNGQTASLSGQTDTDGGKTYTYNGNIKTTNVELFDYYSDSEYGGTGSPSQGWDDGYSNPYNNFNMQVSCSDGSSTSYSGSNNITIKLKKGTKIGSTTYNSAPHIYVWNGSSNNGYPGPQMKYDSNDDSFTYTFNRSDASCSEYISFNPANLEFNYGSDETDLTQSMTAGNTYFFQNKTVIDVTLAYDTTGWNIRAKLKEANGTEHMENMQWHHGDSSGKQHFQLVTAVEDLSYTPKYVNIYGCKIENGNLIYDYQHQSSQATLTMNKINYLYFNGSNGNLENSTSDDSDLFCKTTSSAETIYTGSCLYENPLYFGAFFMSNNENGYTTINKPGTSGGKYGGPYNNFYWQSHISLKGNTNDYSETRGRAALQGLVDPNLTGGVSSGDLQQGGNILPYFSESWAGTHSDVMTYYNKDDTALSKSISFPFYEVTIGATDGIGYQAGDNSAGDSVAKYYQFNSKLNNLYFEKGSTANSGHFVETSWGDHINGDQQGNGNSTDTGGKGPGFFPFNTNSNQNKNYGFGARFDMDFHLNEDGKIAVYDSNDKQQNGAGRVNTRFEFTGDDDLWVFIDGHLVLDLGGAHDYTSGYIDFTERKAVANYAITLGDGNSKDTLYYYKDNNNNNTSEVVTPGSIPVQDTFTDSTNTAWAESGGVVQNDFTKLLNGNNTATTYDTNEQHTLTVFYMERGMFDSNLLIRFNFPIEPNFNKFKIREDTDFSGINEGLRELTMQAAEDDVFKYTVKNKGTKSADVIDGTSLYPTRVNNLRNGRKLTSDNTSYYGSNTEPKSINFNPADTTMEYPMANVSYNWVDGFADNDGMVSDNHVAGITNGDGELFLMFGTSSVKSSAEFEGQLSRYSEMRVTQISGNDCLYKPQINGDSAITFETSTRKYSDYYTLSTPYIFTKKSKSSGYSGTNVTNGNMNVANGASFEFRSDLGSSDTKDADETKEVQMTEYFTNVPNTGGITIKKLLPTGEPVIPSGKTSFTIKVRFEDIFGVEEVDADNETDYTGIKYKVYDSSGTLVNGDGTMTSGTVKVTEGGNEVEKYCGTFKLKVGQTATVEGIPYKTKYIVYENEPKYAPTYDNNNSTVLVGTIDDSSHKAVPLNSTTPNNNNITVTNFSHTLTIKEVTDFSGVNAGLISYTKTAAEKDVFKYTVSNQNTSDSDVVDSGIKTPTYDEYKRINNGETTTLTYHAPVPDTTHIYLDTSKALSGGDTWSSHDAIVGAYIYNSGSGGHTVLGEYVSENLYKFDIAGYSKVYFKRFSPGTSISSSNNSDISADWGNQNDCRITFQQGATYKVDGWSQTILKTSTPVNLYPTESHNYTPSVSGNAVANTNYEWTDEFAGLVGSNADGINGMTGTTSNNGEFYLMHGTEVYTKNSVTYTQDKESSAKFYNQFARGSTMTVVQSDTLTSPNGGTPDTLKANNRGAANTSLATYYTTTKTLEGSTTSDSLTDNVLPTGTNDFAFNNSNSNQSIHITETFTNTVRNGAISVQKKIKNNESTNETFTFQITLEDVFGVDSADVDSTGYGDITISGTNSANSKLTNNGQFTISSTETAKITGIPVGTKYTITEISESASEFEFDINGSSNCSGTVEAYSDKSKQTPDDDNKAVIQNKRKSTSSTEIILKKTAKEQVGTTKIGDTLAGAEFKLVNVNAPNTDIKLKKTDTDPAGAISGTTTKEYSVSNTGTFNITSTSNWIETGEDGRLHIKGLAPGDYYLEEQTAPSGFAATDSNNNNDPKRVYFSVGANTTTLNLTCSDEMAPAYIKLYEHINEKRDAWGNPTFIFKITQTKDANGTSLTAQRTHIVALTVNDNDTIRSTIKWYDNASPQNFTEDPIDDSKYDQWLVEGTTEADYKGMYHIDSKGRIRVAPGEYSITRVPVSRYKFVTSGHIVYNTDAEPTGALTVNGTDTEAAETFSVTEGNTADVHYYDQVAYYDKFTHVDTKINKFYKLNESTQANETIKGLIVRYDGKAGTSTNPIIITTDTNFKAKLIYVDGSERELSDKSNITIDANSNSDITVTNGITINVTNPASHSNNVYTLKAKYDNKFETTFELVFERTP